VDEHWYGTPDWFFSQSTRYDNYGRSGMKIYFGEYAVNQKVGHGNLLGALAEAVFMLGLEKNSDVVKMASYAPLFENINQNIWGVNLILLESSRTAGRSSYQVQKLFSANRPDYVLNTDVQAPQVSITNVQGLVHQLYALGGLDQQRQEVVIKVVNPTPATVPAVIRLKGEANLAGRGKVITLGNTLATAENTLDHPNVVVPVEADMEVSGAEFTCTFNPNSLTILRLPAGKR
jgi:alpha-N-arabinofuranosidase